MKHTEGPWKLERFSEHQGMSIRDKGDLLIAIPMSRMGSKSTDEVIANAELIARAPELLEALGELYFSVYGGNSISLQDCLCRSNAADEFEQKFVRLLTL